MLALSLKLGYVNCMKENEMKKLVDKMIKEEIGDYIWSLIERTNPKYVRNAIERGIVEGWHRGYGEAREEYKKL